jgi:hypothetical protein
MSHPLESHDDVASPALDDVDPPLEIDPVDEGPPGDRRPVRGPTWARAHREALDDDDVADGAAALRVADDGSSQGRGPR